MNDRDELIRSIRDGWPDQSADYYPARGGSFHAPPVRDGGVTAKLIDYAVDVLLAAGYTKPRTISTMEELNDLAEGTVIRTAGTRSEPGRVAVCSTKYSALQSDWTIPGEDFVVDSDELDDLPATVLYEPAVTS